MSEHDLVQAIVFLQERSGEALRLLREQSGRGEPSENAILNSRGPVPGAHDPAVIHLDVVAATGSDLRSLRSYLQDYADQIDEVSGSDVKLVAATDALRRLMEAVYQERITFTGEFRAEDDGRNWDFYRARVAAAAALAADTPDGTQWVLRNLTDGALELSAADQPTYVLPAFGIKTFAKSGGAGGAPNRDEQSNGHDGGARVVQLVASPQATFDDLDSLVAGDKLEVTEVPPATKGESAQLVVLGLEVWLVPIFIVVTLLWGDPSWWVFGIAGFVALPLLARVRRTGWANLAEHSRNALRNAPRLAMEVSSLLLVLFFALVVPAVAVFLGADLYDVVQRAKIGPVADGGPDDLTLVARIMQVLFIAAASMLPALLYFQFDRERLGTIWEKFTRQIYRLDPRVTTEPALLSKYGFLIDEVFGPGGRSRHGTLLPGKRSPIIVATVVISFGWLLTLLNPQVGTISDQAAFVSLFEPHQSAVTFAFLGAYVFALGALLRGYVRRDLRPKSYSDITVRILTVVTLGWLLEVFFPDNEPVLLAFAFATGLVPQTAFTLLRETVEDSRGRRRREARNRELASAKKMAQSSAPAAAGTQPQGSWPDDEPLPLTNLDGIDLYDRARLASEGITNIEALAHCELVELMLQTRIPGAQLVDWVDQAILYLHVSRREAGDESSSYEILRRAGIRNATDLIRAAQKAEKRPAKEKSAFLAILGPVRAGGPQVLEVILDAIGDEEWISNLTYWRSRDDLDNQTVTVRAAKAPPVDPTLSTSGP